MNTNILQFSKKLTYHFFPHSEQVRILQMFIRTRNYGRDHPITRSYHSFPHIIDELLLSLKFKIKCSPVSLDEFLEVIPDLGLNQ